MSPRKRPRRTFLAAPLVVTAVLAPACAGRVYTNPGPPEEPTAQPDPTATPTTDPTTAPTGVEPLTDAPTDGDGKIVKQADGTCLYVFKEPDMSCPPGAHCNPGPPQDPLKVKCPPDAKP